jgi:hypothetical protein
VSKILAWSERNKERDKERKKKQAGAELSSGSS